MVLKKKGGLPCDEQKIENFCNVLADCQLLDVGFSGNQFTWERGNLSETNIRERLDCEVSNDEWMTLFPEVTIQHMSHSFLDYYPLFITTKRAENWVTTKAFKFEAWWIMEELFNEKVKNI